MKNAVTCRNLWTRCPIELGSIRPRRVPQSHGPRRFHPKELDMSL